MATEFAKNQFNELSGLVGRAGLNALFPNDFEVYLMALELTDSSGNTIDYLSFPVMPEQISKTETSRSNIKKTSGGTTVLSSNSYVPGEITIKGNFGLGFKILISPKTADVEGVAFSITNGKGDLFDLNEKSGLSFTMPGFNAGIKTGYGAIKILQSILSKSNGIDGQGKPFRLYLYNMALGESYLVKLSPSGYTLSQNKDKNMIWEYNMNLTVLAPLKALGGGFKSSSLVKVLAVGAIQKGVNVLAKTVLNTIS